MGAAGSLYRLHNSRQFEQYKYDSVLKRAVNARKSYLRREENGDLNIEKAREYREGEREKSWALTPKKCGSQGRYGGYVEKPEIQISDRFEPRRVDYAEDKKTRNITEQISFDRRYDDNTHRDRPDHSGMDPYRRDIPVHDNHSSQRRFPTPPRFRDEDVRVHFDEHIPSVFRENTLVSSPRRNPSPYGRTQGSTNHGRNHSPVRYDTSPKRLASPRPNRSLPRTLPLSSYQNPVVIHHDVVPRETQVLQICGRLASTEVGSSARQKTHLSSTENWR